MLTEGVVVVISRVARCRLGVWAAVVLLGLGHGLANADCGQSETPLQLYFNERPPYMTSVGSEVHGVVADVVNRVLQHAAIHYQWRQWPTNRHLLMLEHSQECGCAVGWFQLPERLPFAQFSRPLYRDGATVAVVRADFQEPAKAEFRYWLQQPGLRVLTKQRYSYGPYLDQLLASSSAQRLTSTEETADMLQHVLLNKADLIFLAADEANWQLTHRFADQPLRVVQFTDAPAPQTRHLMCNYAVPAPLLQRINAELPETM